MQIKKNEKKFTVFIFLTFFCIFDSFSAAVKHVSPIEGIDWTFETTMGFQTLNNSIMSKESNSASIKKEVLFFYGILYHAYLNKIPMLKAQMNLGLKEHKFILWSDNPDFNHSNEQLNELLRCIEVDVQYLLPSVKIYKGTFIPFFGYSFYNYSYSKSFSTAKDDTFKFNAFSVGLEYNTKISKSIRHNYYFSFAPLLFNENQHIKPYLYFNYGAEAIFDTKPVAVTLFLAFKNGLNADSKLLHKKSYVFSNTELGLSFHISLNG
ncbi:hypothetical protein [Treponema sp.]|uniref:hypothetical protein n=1 Tax=Treponema sp. TaxID=166 RepID=UPI003FD80099